jgi:hypothetical protein
MLFLRSSSIRSVGVFLWFTEQALISEVHVVVASYQLLRLGECQDFELRSHMEDTANRSEEFVFDRDLGCQLCA